MNAVKEDMEKLVLKELASANERFSLFSSNHEGYAVIKEEIEEAIAEQKELCNYINDLLDFTWSGVKMNLDNQHFNVLMKSMHDTAVNLACEAVQVAAVAQKFIDSAEKRDCDIRESIMSCEECSFCKEDEEEEDYE